MIENQYTNQPSNFPTEESSHLNLEQERLERHEEVELFMKIGFAREAKKYITFQENIPDNQVDTLIFFLQQGEEAEKILIEKHHDLVEPLVHKEEKYPLESLDTIQSANDVLLEAIRNFNYSGKERFFQYLEKRISLKLKDLDEASKNQILEIQYKRIPKKAIKRNSYVNMERKAEMIIAEDTLFKTNKREMEEEIIEKLNNRENINLLWEELEQIDKDTKEIIIKRCGLDGEEPLSINEIATQLGKTEKEVVSILQKGAYHLARKVAKNYKRIVAYDSLFSKSGTKTESPWEGYHERKKYNPLKRNIQLQEEE